MLANRITSANVPPAGGQTAAAGDCRIAGLTTSVHIHKLTHTHTMSFVTRRSHVHNFNFVCAKQMQTRDASRVCITHGVMQCSACGALHFIRLSCTRLMCARRFNTFAELANACGTTMDHTHTNALKRTRMHAQFKM